MSDAARQGIADALHVMPPMAQAANGRVIREALSLFAIKQRLDERGLHLSLDHVQRILNVMAEDGEVELVCGMGTQLDYRWSGDQGYDVENAVRGLAA